MAEPFAGLLAPQIFNGNYEYPILVALALLCMPGIFAGGIRKAVTEALAVAAAERGAGAGLVRHPSAAARDAWNCRFKSLLALLAAAMLFQRQRLMRFFGLVVLSFAITALWRPGIAPIETARSFFGVHRVAEIADGKARILYHGTTIHGAQRLRNDDGTPVDGPPTPLTYYYPGGPFAEAIDAARGCSWRFSVMSPWSGSVPGRWPAIARPGSSGRSSRSIPEVIRIARDPRLFTFLSSCAPDAPVVAGDARLTLEASSDRYDLIVLDAFSSDSIPVHLLTREALAGYLSKLSPAA